MMYSINIGDYTVGDTVYTGRCLSANLGQFPGAIPCDTIPWEGVSDKPWDFKYEDGEFIHDPIEDDAPANAPTTEERLEALEAVVLEMMGV